MSNDAPKGGERERFEVTLPSGATARVLKKGKGADIMIATRMAGGMQDQGKFLMAMIAVKAVIDGRALTIEDVLELDDLDGMALIGHVMSGAGGKASAGDTSPPAT